MNYIPFDSYRQEMYRKLQHLRSNYNHIKFSMENRMKLKDRVSFDSQRKELLQGASGSSRDISLDLAESGSLDRFGRIYTLQCNLCKFRLCKLFMIRSGQKLNEYIAVGQESLNELLSQRDRLKGVQRKVFDILNYLGISNRIIKMAEQREYIDKWIVYIGMLLITILIFVLWYFYRRK